MKAFTQVEETKTELAVEEEQPANSSSTVREQFAYQPTNSNDDVRHALSPDFDRSEMFPSPTEGTASLADYNAEQRPHLTIQQYARCLRAEVKLHADRLASAASMRDIDLTRPCASLTLADSVDDIIDFSLEVLARMQGFRRILTRDLQTQQRILRDAEIMRMPEAILARHRATLVEYVRYEHDTRTVHMNMSTQIEHLRARQAIERYGSMWN